MNLYDFSTKEIGSLGESVVAGYLSRKGFEIVVRNTRTSSGELDIVAAKNNCMHIVEVKSLRCRAFPGPHDDVYDPSENLHSYKLKKVIRTAEWYLATLGWEGEWQVDGALVWLRECDGIARIRYYPQIA